MKAEEANEAQKAAAAEAAAAFADKWVVSPTSPTTSITTSTATTASSWAKAHVQVALKGRSRSNRDDHFAVRAIIAHRGSGHRTKYLVDWEGCSWLEQTWEPVGNLRCPELLAAYLAGTASVEEADIVQKEKL